MLIDFEVENFRSFREAKRFSFVASSIKELPENVFETPVAGLKLLKTAAVYGANASGKSNLLEAMRFLGLLLRPPNELDVLKVAHSPFLLDDTSRSKPTRFKVRFVVESTLYEYSISVSDKIVTNEHLIAYPKGRPQEWFTRSKEGIEFRSPHLKGEKKTLRNVTGARISFLAVAFAFNHPQLIVPASWIRQNLNHLSEESEEGTAEALKNNTDFQRWAVALMRHADVGIESIEIKISEELTGWLGGLMGSRGVVRPRTPILGEKHKPFFVHSGMSGVTETFPLRVQSLGTKRLFTMLWPFYQVLRDGDFAIVDELGSSMHPLLVIELLRLFHNPKTNPNNAQLLFTTHDTSLLKNRILRRDQVWLTEKNQSGETDLYSLHDIKNVRKDEAIEEGYLRGRYGAIPFFSPFELPPIEDKNAELASKSVP